MLILDCGVARLFEHTAAVVGEAEPDVRHANLKGPTATDGEKRPAL